MSKKTSGHTASPYNLLSDEELFERIKQNDAKAFDVLYQRFGRRVFLYCQKMLNDKDMAADVFHDVMIKIYEKKDTFLGGNLASWIFTIARTRCINAIRDKKHTFDINDFSDSLANSAPDLLTEDATLNTALHEAIRNLPAEFKEALILRQFSEFSYQEVADLLGISVSLAKVRVFRAIKLLQQTLSPYINEIQK